MLSCFPTLSSDDLRVFLRYERQEFASSLAGATAVGAITPAAGHITKPHLSQIVDEEVPLDKPSKSIENLENQYKN